MSGNYKENNIAKENADAVASMLNNMCFDEAKFCREMASQHRTLQQNFTRLCVAWLNTCGSPSYQYDARNEGSHRLGESLAPVLRDVSLPYI